MVSGRSSLARVDSASAQSQDVPIRPASAPAPCHTIPDWAVPQYQDEAETFQDGQVAADGSLINLEDARQFLLPRGRDPTRVVTAALSQGNSSGEHVTWHDVTHLAQPEPSATLPVVASARLRSLRGRAAR